MIRIGEILKHTAASTATTAELQQSLGENWMPPSDLHPVACYLARISAGSRRTMRGAARDLAHLLSLGRQGPDTLAWHAVRYQHTAALRAVLAERYAPATANKMLAALRGILRECWKLGHMDSESFFRSCAIDSVKGERLPAGRALPPGEIRAMFQACADDPRPRARRDAAVLALLYGCGLRRSEVVKITLADYEPTSGRLLIRQAKGDRDRVLFVPPGAAEALADWIAVRGSAPGPILCPVTRRGEIDVRHMNNQSIYAQLHDVARAAGLPPIAPHDCRRTYVSELLDAGADLSAVRQLAGHARIDTTARYDRRGEVAMQRAATLLPVPYIRPAAAPAGPGEELAADPALDPQEPGGTAPEPKNP